MEDNNIHNQDVFSESIKSKLENYQMPLDESVWKGIEKQLTPKKNRVVPFWFWLSSGVAASFLVIFLLNPFKITDNTLAVKKSIEINKTEQIKTAVAIQNNSSALENSNQEQIKTTVPKKNRNKELKIKTTVFKNSFSIAQNDTQKQQIIKTDIKNRTVSDIKTTEFQANEVNLGVANSDLQKKDSIPAKKTEPKLASLPEMPEVLELPKEKTKKKLDNNWLLAANFGTCGSSDFNFSTGGEMSAISPDLTVGEAYGDKLSQYASASNAYLLQPNDFDNVEYLNPVSVGVSVQKGLTSNLSISSGLIYTFLRSNYSLSNQWEQADASLDLHYLGVPLNLNVLIAQKKHWNYYFSVGGMIEKGLRSIYKQTIKYQGSNVHQTDVYSKIDGIQTSADAAFGVGYNLKKNWSLYFEPKLTCYFKNNQPMSARTETPVNVGFNGGLKVGF